MRTPDPEGLARARRVNAACEQFEADWRRGERRAVEEFVRDGLDPLERDALLVELLALERELRREADVSGEISEPRTRVADNASEIGTLLGRFQAADSDLDETVALEPSGVNEPGGDAHFVSFGDYELLHEIARGGMGVVFRARQKSLKRDVALKMILAGQFASAAERDRFLLEAELAANLDHAHIVPIYEIGEQEGRLYFSMKLVDGESLSRRLRHFAGDPEAAARLLVTVARAVHYAHGRGFLHCDLKPANILVDGQGEPHVTDFGLAKRVGDSTLTATGVLLGTPSYMAPEQASGRRGELSPATDVYGLGAILYELLTGRPPFRGPSLMETVGEVMEREPRPPRQVRTGVPEGLERICLRCLEKAPRDRYATAEELAENLERYLRGEDIEGTSIPARLRRWTRREPELVSRLGGLGLMVALNEYNYSVSTAPNPRVYLIVLAVLLAWALASFVFQVLVRRGLRPEAVRVGWAATDIVLLTTLLKILGAMESTLVVGYPLLIAASGLWYRVRLVWLTTGLAMAAYGMLVLDKLLVDPTWRSAQFPNIFLAALAVNGFVVARQVKRICALSSYYERRPIT
ncbi:MAG: serine/threonine-protein kinase [Isosphaeraceae bacterium]|nr:serine/threonine-protein kinase [Isosphaeraceae bacterium]